VFILFVFILLGIFKNREGKYLKQSAIALMVISNIFALIIIYVDVNKGGARQVGWLDAQDLPLYFGISIHGLVAGLLMYLYTSVKR
jgi:hypothetical protein